MSDDERDELLLFWSVDNQHDFIDEDGALPVPGAEGIRANLARISKLVDGTAYQRVSTMDWHTLDDDEIVEEGADFENTFPPHCMRGTPGVGFIPEAMPSHTEGIVNPMTEWEDLYENFVKNNDIVLRKVKFDVFEGNKSAGDIVNAINPDQVIVYGVAGDVCVHQAVCGLVERGYNVTVVTDAVASLGDTPEKEWLDMGVTLKTTDEIYNEYFR